MSLAAQPQVETDRFRILVADDEDEIPREVRRQFADDPSVLIEIAQTPEEARRRLRETYFDGVNLDIMFRTDRLAGIELIRNIGELAPTASVLVVTQLNDVWRMVQGHRRQIVGILEKDELAEDWALSGFAADIARWRRRGVAVANAELVLDALDARERRERIPGLRSKAETGVELDRLCRSIFGRVTGIGQPVHVRLRRLEREGLSASATVTADVHIGQDVKADDLPGAVTVLKVGPVCDIRAEVANYEQFVKYGVRLTHRVELLGHAFGHALGAISYSFAGGVFGVAHTSLDDLLRSPSHDAITEAALRNLFEASSRNWYAIKLRPVPPGNYFRSREIGLDIRKTYDRMNGSLRNVRRRFQRRGFRGKVSFDQPDRDHGGQLRVGDAIVRIPAARTWGQKAFVPAYRTSLIHGDMHGGNVMVELDGIADPAQPEALRMRRVCLIDFRRSGRGPRLLDFVALEASVRLADAHAIVRANGAEEERDLTDEALLLALEQAARRVQAERSLARERYDGDPIPKPERWQRWVLRLDVMATWNFDDITPGEQQTTAALYVLRQMGLQLGPVSRTRLLAWMEPLVERLATEEDA